MDISSKERMINTFEYKPVDYTPCSFMIFSNLFEKSRNQREFIEKESKMGLDAVVNVGKLDHSLNPDVKVSEWVETAGGEKYFNRKIDTPRGPLTQKVIQRNSWPTEEHFPIFDDWLVPRTKEFLVKPEQDLEKIRYLFGPFKKSAIDKLREEAKAAKEIARSNGLLQAAGLIGWGNNNIGWWTYQISCIDVMSWISGFENTMILSMTSPGIIQEYAKILSDWNTKQIEVYLEVTDADLIARRAWYETTEFWTPGSFKKIIAPTIKREADLVHQAGKKYAYIITAAFLPVIDYILDSGIDVLVGIDPVEGKGTDLGMLKEKFYSKEKTIWGGVSGAVTVENGTEEETRQAVTRAMEILAPGGFILSPVDNVSDDTENAWRNTEKFIETWKEYREKYL